MLSGESSPDLTDFFGSLPNYELSPFSSHSSCLSPNSNWIANKLASPTPSITMEKIVMKHSAITPAVNSLLNPSLAAQLTRSDILSLGGIGQYWGHGGSDLDTPPIILGHLEPGNELSFNDVDHYFDPSIEESINLDAFIQNDVDCPEDLIVDRSSFEPTSYLNVKTDTPEFIEQTYEEFEEVDKDVLFNLPTVVQEEEVTNVEYPYGEQELEQDPVVSDVQDILTISAEDLSTLGQFYYITPLEVNSESKHLPRVVSTEYIDIQEEDVKVVDLHKIKSEQRSQKIELTNAQKPRRESFKAPTPSSIKANAAARPVSNAKSTPRQRRLSSVTKDSEDYRDKRDRNNASVRKSRDKARQKQEETETRLEILSTENNRLQDKVDSLEKELSILRGLFKDAGSIPFAG